MDPKWPQIPGPKLSGFEHMCTVIARRLKGKDVAGEGGARGGQLYTQPAQTNEDHQSKLLDDS